MCKLSKQEETILVNLRNTKPDALAKKLGIERSTLDTYLSRVRAKRLECKAFLKKTDQYKRELYPRRKGE